MSGIYIPGMEMPKSCDECWAEYAYEICNSHSGTCPLVPVPEHGRLIDADALGISLEKLAADKWNQKTAPVNWSYAFEECLEMVDNAPTIIEQNFIKAPTIIEAEEAE